MKKVLQDVQLVYCERCSPKIVKNVFFLLQHSRWKHLRAVCVALLNRVSLWGHFQVGLLAKMGAVLFPGPTQLEGAGETRSVPTSGRTSSGCRACFTSHVDDLHLVTWSHTHRAVLRCITLTLKSYVPKESRVLLL